MGPSGVMLMMGEASEDDLRAAFAQQARAMADAGADAIVVETMTDPAEARLAVSAAKETGLPVVACMTFDSGAKLDRTMMGTTPEQAAEQLLDAGADMIVAPSRFEPCGLTQLIALRYGTVPIARSVGGLADTVFDKDYSNRPLHERNGYVFERADNAALESTLQRAIACYYKFPEHFRHLMLNGMRSDYSWNHPGQHYLNIYNYIRDK